MLDNDIKNILFFAHRKRFISYFKFLSEGNQNSKIIGLPEVFKSFLFLYLPPKTLISEVLSYEIKKRFYKPYNKTHNLKKLVLYMFLYLKLIIFYSSSKRFLRANFKKTVVVWGAGGFYQKIFTFVARQNMQQVLIMENGFLPDTTAIDSKGVNALCSLPRDPNFYRNLDSKTLPNNLPNKLVVRELKHKHAHIVPENVEKKIRPYFFIPFQCNGDSVIIQHSSFIQNMWQLFDVILEVAKAFPEIEFCIKEHPSCPEDYSKLYEKLQESSLQNVYFKNSGVTEELIKKSLGVITINSSVGFESLLFEKPVISLGDAAYNIDCITMNVSDIKGVVEALNMVLQGWTPDKELNALFLRYVYNVYLVHGTKNNLTSEYKNNFQEHLIKFNR